MKSEKAGMRNDTGEVSTSFAGRNLGKRAASTELKHVAASKRKRRSRVEDSEWIKDLGLTFPPKINDESRLERLFALEDGAEINSEEDKRNKIRIALSLCASVADWFSILFWKQDDIAHFVSVVVAIFEKYVKFIFSNEVSLFAFSCRKTRRAKTFAMKCAVLSMMKAKKGQRCFKACKKLDLSKRKHPKSQMYVAELFCDLAMRKKKGVSCR